GVLSLSATLADTFTGRLYWRVPCYALLVRSLGPVRGGFPDHAVSGDSWHAALFPPGRVLCLVGRHHFAACLSHYSLSGDDGGALSLHSFLRLLPAGGLSPGAPDGKFKVQSSKFKVRRRKTSLKSQVSNLKSLEAGGRIWTIGEPSCFLRQADRSTQPRLARQSNLL